jgi:hypothetical protein
MGGSRTDMIVLTPIVFLAVTSPILIIAHRKKHQAITTIIAKYSPQLSQRLRDEGIG